MCKRLHSEFKNVQKVEQKIYECTSSYTENVQVLTHRMYKVLHKECASSWTENVQVLSYFQSRCNLLVRHYCVH